MMVLRLLWLVLLCNATLLALGCQPVVQEARGWSKTFQRTDGYGWSGGDAAYSVALPDDRTLWLFGDSVIGYVRGDRRESAEFRFGNTIAIQRNPEPGQEPLQADSALSFDWGPRGSSGWLPILPRTLEDGAIPSKLRTALDAGDLVLAWPLHGIVIGRDLVLFNAVTTSCGNCNAFGFEVHGSAASIVRGVDRPYEQWGVERGLGWQTPLTQRYVSTGRQLDSAAPTPSLLWGTFVLSDPTQRDAVLVYGHAQQGTSSALVVARVAPVTSGDDLLDFPRWAFWDGRSWQSQPEASRGILPQSAVELSVIPIPEMYGGGYAVVHGGYELSGNVRVAVASSPLGPFVERYVFALADCPIAGFNPADPPAVYAVKAHAHLADDDAMLVSLVLSPGEVSPTIGTFEQTNAYVPRFLHLPWDEVMHHTHSATERCDMN